MKSKSPHSLFSLVLLAAVFLGVSLIQSASAGPLNAAAGRYKGKLSGSAEVPFLGTQRLPKTNANLKLPRGKGRVVIRIVGFERATGRVTKARVRQGGKRVVQTGRTQIPASITGPIGSITGPFRAIVNLKGKKPKVRATTSLAKFGASARGTFIGSK